MFFVLSKTVSFLAMPLVIVCILLILSWIIRRFRKPLFWTGLGLLLFFSNDFIANSVMRAWEVDPIAFNDLDTARTWGIVLTGTTIPRLQPGDRVYFQRGADRLLHTVQLYKLGYIRKIIVSGGSGMLISEGIPEADELASVMRLLGVAAKDLVIENTSRNTHESAVEVAKILEARHIDSRQCLLITSGFHMRRSMACYRKGGLEPLPFSTDFYAYPPVYTPDTFLIPKLEALIIWHKLFKEWVGLTAYWVAGYV